ncbi:DUF1671-domain-containing protein, partial [Laetiporus sulphureus 93-53]
QNIFWNPTQTGLPPRNFSPGLIPVIRRALRQSHEKGKTQCAWLCHEGAVHVASEAFDRTWGCGYRNFLMACASLMVQDHQPMYFPLLDHPVPPGVRNLQSMIEEAWANGYDQEGAEQLKRHLVGTGKFIGTGELYVAYTYRGIPAQLVDFELADGPEPLMKWVMEHFSSGTSSPKHTTLNEALKSTNSVIVTDKMPIILQHNGHSRTVVGCERCPDGSINLLVFDPSTRILADVRDAGLANCRSTDPIETQYHRHVSPSQVLHEVLHPVQTIKPHKHKMDDEILVPDTVKKSRICLEELGKQDRADSFHASRNGLSQKQPDLTKVLNVFRLRANKLKKKRLYQVLYFPLTDPLSEDERWARRELTCLKVN